MSEKHHNVPTILQLSLATIIPGMQKLQHGVEGGGGGGVGGGLGSKR